MTYPLLWTCFPSLLPAAPPMWYHAVRQLALGARLPDWAAAPGDDPTKPRGACLLANIAVLAAEMLSKVQTGDDAPSAVASMLFVLLVFTVAAAQSSIGLAKIKL
jgi:hypothetical protein